MRTFKECGCLKAPNKVSRKSNRKCMFETTYCLKTTHHKLNPPGNISNVYKNVHRVCPTIFIVCRLAKIRDDKKRDK